MSSLPDCHVSPGLRGVPKHERARDRRSGLGDVLAALVDAVFSGDARWMRARLEESLCRAGGFRSVRLQVGQALGAGTMPIVRDTGHVDIPVVGGAPAVLQVMPRIGGLDAWSMQVLQGGADLAAIILELERLVGATGRSGAASRLEPLGLVGSSANMHDLRGRIERVARADVAVLVEGESGVGKELVARQIHQLSRRSRGPFVAVNCAALVETLLEAELFGIEERTATGVRGRRGKFEQADGGTLFLDEIGDLSAAAQAKLLRALQDLRIERVGGVASQRVDVRIVAATNRNLHDLVSAGRFRADLYYRLNCVEIHVPALRDRRSDIPELVDYFLTRHSENETSAIAPEAMEALLDYAWPGNVRELERVVQRALTLVTADRIELTDLPASVTKRYLEALQPSLHAGDSLRLWASRYVRLMLGRCDNNKRRACEVLDISYHTLQAYLRFGMPPRRSTTLRVAGKGSGGTPPEA